jgi:hypothetical protein
MQYLSVRRSRLAITLARSKKSPDDDRVEMYWVNELRCVSTTILPIYLLTSAFRVLGSSLTITS